MSAFPSYFVDPSQLSAALDPASTKTSSSSSSSSTPTRIIPLCASWFLPNDPQSRTGRAVFAASRIPHARFFDLDAVKDHDSAYPHMLPTAETFAAAMSDLGLRRDDTLVVYDSAELGLFSAPRVAWTLKVFGHEHVHILNNFRAWVAGGYPLEKGEEKEVEAETPARTRYPVPTFDPDRVIAYREVKEIVRSHLPGAADAAKPDPTQIVDVRSAGRFEGSAPEPRPGLSSGHMPGAINIPLPELLDAETGVLRPGPELRAVFERHGLDASRPVVSTCGTGVMAACCDAALERAEFGRLDERRVYDGSWTEWAMRVKPDEGLIVKGK